MYAQVEPNINFMLGEHKNRDEIIYVDFDSILQAQCMNITLGLIDYLENIDELEDGEEISLLKKCESALTDMIKNYDNPVDLYYAVAPLSSFLFFNTFLGLDLKEDEIYKLIDLGFSRDTYKYQIKSDMATGFKMLCKARYVKEIHICINRKPYVHDLEYITKEIFENDIDKVYISERANMYDMYLHNVKDHTATTYILDDKSVIKDIVTSEHYVDNEYVFLLASSMSNMTHGEYGLIEDDSDIKALQEDKIFGFSRFKPTIRVTEVSPES